VAVQASEALSSEVVEIKAPPSVPGGACAAHSRLEHGASSGVGNRSSMIVADVADALHRLARALAAHRRALVTVGGGAERSAA